MANVVTNAGLAFLTLSLTGSGLGTLYGSSGTGAGSVAATDAAMFTEETTVGRTAATITRVTKTVTNDSIQIAFTLNYPTTNETITEVGVWSASSGGTLMYHRDSVNTPVGPTNGTTSVQFTETITL